MIRTITFVNNLNTDVTINQALPYAKEPCQAKLMPDTIGNDGFNVPAKSSSSFNFFAAGCSTPTNMKLKQMQNDYLNAQKISSKLFNLNNKNELEKISENNKELMRKDDVREVYASFFVQAKKDKHKIDFGYTNDIKEHVNKDWDYSCNINKEGIVDNTLSYNVRKTENLSKQENNKIETKVSLTSDTVTINDIDAIEPEVKSLGCGK